MVVGVVLMLQITSMLNLRKKPGELIDMALYRKDRILIKRKGKSVAVLVPIEDYQMFIDSEDDIEIYSKERIGDFDKADKLTNSQKKALDKILSK